METQTIRAIFEDPADAESAVGRLEVAGVPVESIAVSGGDTAASGIRAGGTVVTAQVDTALREKALGILSAEGTLDPRA